MSATEDLYRAIYMANGSTLNDGEAVRNVIGAFIAAQQDGAWQPIETAPLDQYVLVAHEGVVSEARYNLEDRNWWMACTGPYDFDASSPIYPTHWCPLPAPPTI